MKKILSMLLAMLLVMSSMATVVFADTPEVITFGEYLAKLPAGSKIIVNTGDVAEGNTVVATINGVAAPLTKADGYYAVTVPAGDNNISVAVKNGDAVVAQTATINVFGVSYLGEGVRGTDATFETDSTNLVGNKFGYYDAGMNPSWYTSSVANGRASIENETGNQYISLMTWGTAVSDPNSGEGYTKVANGGGTQLASSVNRTPLANVAKISVDYRFDKMDVIDPETGVLSQTLLMRTTDEIKATKNYFGGDGVILANQYWWDDTDDYNLNGTTTDERTGFTYWYLDFGTGKPTFRAYNADGTAKTVAVDNFNEGWNNYCVIVDVPNDMVYGYINDIYVGSGHLAGVAYASTHEKSGQRKLVTAKQGTWPYTYNLRPTKDDNVVCYSSFDNFLVDTYANGFASTEPTIEATNKIAETTLPAGTKTQISVVAANIPAGGAIAAFVNGVKTNLTAIGDTYNCNIPLTAGYTSVYVAMVDANGKIVKDSEGTEIKSAEWTYYAFGISENSLIGLDFDLEDGLDETDGYPARVGIDAKNLSGYFTNKKAAMVTEANGNNYLQLRSWTDAGFDPNPEVDGYTKAADTKKTPITGNAKRRSGEQNINPNFIVDVSVDFRFEQFNVKINDVITEVPVTSKAVFDAYKGKLYEATVISSLKFYRADDGATNYTAFPSFVITRQNGYQAVYYDVAGVKKTVDLSWIDPSQWHTFRTVVNGATDKVYLYVDDEFVASGYAAPNTANTAYADVTGYAYPEIALSRIYDNNTYDSAVFAGWDNWTVTEYTDGEVAAPTAAVVNAAITAEGATLGIVPANLGLVAEEAMDIAVVARTAAGAVEIQKYEDVTSESSYKAFTFDMADIDKVFVWDWETLAPIVEAIE